ncbi:MAG: LL-diaminopimelate aminotransferase [Candidatus Electrothrix sp. GM3_4]|nr:LL-diaminopimelate aminotransferase [Candidatus Electrothrix sp. GM3_4]
MAGKNSILSGMSSDNSSFVDFIENKLLKIVDTYKKKHSRPVYTMSFGYTSHPLPPSAVQAMADYALGLGQEETYSSYEPVTGNATLKQKLADHYQQRSGVSIDPDDFFVTDGAQLACSAVQELFAGDGIVALQDPSYPAFIEGTRLAGRRYISLSCSEENGFIPVPPKEKADIICLCFPNNPTGQTATYQQLRAFVDYAREHQAVIIFDAAYRSFVTSVDVPSSIYEVEGAESCAIEIGSFSKDASFTGLRVGWCIIPKSLNIQDTVQGELHRMWSVQHQMKFWGPANISQCGATALLSEQGQKECQEIVSYYLDNARMLRKGMEQVGLTCFGGTDNPYVWLKAPPGMDDWDFLTYLMHHTGLVGAPGSMFGAAGKGYLRLSALGRRSDIDTVLRNLPDSLPKQ